MTQNFLDFYMKEKNSEVKNVDSNADLSDGFLKTVKTPEKSAERTAEKPAINLNRTVDETPRQIQSSPQDSFIKQEIKKPEVSPVVEQPRQPQATPQIQRTVQMNQNAQTVQRSVQQIQNAVQGNTQNIQAQQTKVQQTVQRPATNPIQNPVQQTQSRQGQPRQKQVDERFTDEYILKLFKKTETKPAYFEKWKEIYLSSFKTKKKSYVVEKCKIGQFTLRDDGSLEILPSYPTQGKSTNDLLKELTKPGRDNLMFMG